MSTLSFSLENPRFQGRCQVSENIEKLKKEYSEIYKVYLEYSDARESYIIELGKEGYSAVTISKIVRAHSAIMEYYLGKNYRQSTKMSTAKREELREDYAEKVISIKNRFYALRKEFIDYYKDYYTQAQLSMVTGISRSYIQKILKEN